MKHLVKLLLTMQLCFIGYLSEAQLSLQPLNGPAVIFSPRIGYDIPFFNNNTPYIDYKGGLEFGASLDYYWSWFGMGFDYDYIKNKTHSTYPTANIYNPSLITNFSLTEGKITRSFYGLGPDFMWAHPANRFMIELNTRTGLGNIKGGRVLLYDAVAGDVLNFHAGYNVKNKFATKAQTRFTYFFNNYIGINAGVYYIRHFGTSELTEMGVSSAYQPLTSPQSGINIFDGKLQTREYCNCDVSSVGFFGGITFKIPITEKEECSTCCKTYALAVTARDKYTGQLLANTDVVVKKSDGSVVATGTTNSYGVVVFDPIKPDNYTIEGKLYEVALEPTSTRKEEFVHGETLQKEILYTNQDFILEGTAVICNTSTGLSGVKVTLKNTTLGEQKSTMTDQNGKYILHVQQNRIYSIYGQKLKYFSQTETINTSDFNRNTTLFVKLEICLEEADCGASLALKNIHYDLDKYYIRDDAKPELEKVAQFMFDNPDVKVELSSHTDSRASTEYNQTLSQNRANAAIDYLVTMGVSRDRLIGIGYGETRLLNGCADGVNCTEAQHQINRRTEIKVICN
ncbi:MAG: OmpA family protein [Flavobacteriales bacterium]|nr:OmpA family protein [Flavobacteriales bacterium]